MRRKERLKLIATVRKEARDELLAELAEKKRQEDREMAVRIRRDRERERLRQVAAYEENRRNFELYDQVASQISRAENELFMASPAYIKYMQLRRSQGQKKRTHGLHNGNWKAP
jgi:hypothetical protein